MLSLQLNIIKKFPAITRGTGDIRREGSAMAKILIMIQARSMRQLA